MWLVFLIPAAIVLGLIISVRRDDASRDMIRAWTAENGCRLLYAEKRSILLSPFALTSSRDQTVYRATFMTLEGQRSAWVRCGSFMGGITFSNHVQVRWD